MNEEQKAYWNEIAGPRWAAADEALGRIEQPFLDRLLEAARPQAGESVLDVGCGSGRSTELFARAVGQEGRVVGIDLSRPLLDLANARLLRAGLLDVATLVEGDAQTHRFAAELDLVSSIFGIMFFEDPRAAFENLRRATRPGGRIAFLCWRSPRENPWVSVPIGAAAAHLEVARPEPGAPGPFAFADPSLVQDVLEAAGYRSIDIAPCDAMLDVAPSVAGALELLLRIGPLASPLAQAEPVTRLRAIEAIREALEEHAAEGPVRLAGATWLVSASP